MAEMEEYTLKLNVQDLQVIERALGAQPFNMVSPIIAKIDQQLKKQAPSASAPTSQKIVRPKTATTRTGK
jgi:hypothetical protein